MNAETEVALDTLHQAILDHIAAAFPALATVVRTEVDPALVADYNLFQTKLTQLVHQPQEAFHLALLYQPLGEGAQLVHVVGPLEGPGSQGMGIGIIQALDQLRAVLQADHHLGAEFLVSWVRIVVGPRPLFHFLGADTVPQFHGGRPVGSFRESMTAWRSKTWPWARTMTPSLVMICP